MADTDREADLRHEYIDRAVKAVVKIEEKWKALCTVDESSSWTESYFRETNEDDSDGGTGSPIKGVPEYAPFPFFDVTETKYSSIVEKYAGESIISMEAQQYATIPMLQRKIYRLGRKLIYQVDAAIEAVCRADAGNAVTIAAGSEWDSATENNRRPIKDILDAVQLLREDGVDVLAGKGYIVVNGQDYTNIISNDQVINHPTYKSGVMTNGKVGSLLGLTIVVSEVIPADTAYVLLAKHGMVWKSAQDLTIKTIVDEGKSTTIRAWERGVFQLQNPLEICRIDNTRK